MVWLYQIVSSSSLVEGHLVYFQFLAMQIKAAMENKGRKKEMRLIRFPTGILPAVDWKGKIE